MQRTAYLVFQVNISVPAFTGIHFMWSFLFLVKSRQNMDGLQTFPTLRRSLDPMSKY